MANLARSLTLLFSMIFSLPALSAPIEHGYTGFTYGLSEIDIDSVDDKGNTLGMYFGYRLSKYIALEGGFMGLGKVSETISGVDITASARGYHFDVKGLFPIGERIDLYVKGGLFSWSSEIEVGTFDIDDDGRDAYFGLGASFLFDYARLLLEYNKYDLDDLDVEQVSIGVELPFF